MLHNSVTLKNLSILALLLLGLTNWTSIVARPFDSGALTRLSSRTNPANDRMEAGLGDVTEAKPGLAEGDRSARARVVEDYAKIPLSFEANQGQADPRVRFISRGSNHALFLSPAESVLVLNAPEVKSGAGSKKTIPVKRRRAALRISLVNTNPSTMVEGIDELPGKTNYFIGKDSSRWRSNIPNYSRVQYRGVYPGVDLIYYGNPRGIEFDFVVTPGADYRKIQFAVKGARRTRIDSSGDLVLSTAVGEVRQQKPLVYQEVDGARRGISARYVFNGKRRVGFEIGEHDSTKPLIIDPVLDYSTFLGGISTDIGRDIVLDSSGNAYVTGHTFSFNFPVTIDSFDSTYANSADLFVTKLNASGSAMVYSTYIGGNIDDNGFGIFVDSVGEAYVTGSTSSTDYPTTPGAFQTTFRGGSFPGDAFVTKLNNTGSALVYSTFLGGTNSDEATGIAVDSLGNAYTTGFTFSTNFPVTPGAFQTTNAGGSFPPGDAFITKLNSTGTAPVYSTLLGGTRFDQGSRIVVDSLGRAFVGGTTNSSDFDITAGAFQTTFGGSQSIFEEVGDAFVTELNDLGTALIYSTYVGGRANDGALDIAINSDGEASICGVTTSVNFPTTPGVVRVLNGGAARSNNAAGNWLGINSGITDGNVVTFAIDPATPSTVYVGTASGGVFKSTDGGSNWMASNFGLTILNVRSLVIDPVMPTTLYLGTSGRGVFKSTDAGGSWRGINTGEGGSVVNALVINPLNPSIVYAGTDFGIFKTTNGGASWATSRSNTFVQTMAIDRLNPANVYAGTFSGVLVTKSSGEEWAVTGLNNGLIRAIQVDPLSSANVYAGGEAGVLKSTDIGLTWQGINVGLSDRMINAIAIDPIDSSAIYAGTGNGVFKSTNGGAGWTLSNNGLAGSSISVVAVDPVTPAIVYSGAATVTQDGFVTKLNNAGDGLVYSTYLGGSDFDTSNSIALDSANNAYVTGQTESVNFPTTPATFQSLASSFDSDAYVTKFDPTGGVLVYSTYLGGNNSSDQGLAITVDSSFSAYVTGTTSSPNFPTTQGAFQTTLSGFSNDGFVAKLNPIPALLTDLRVTMTGPMSTLTPNAFVNYTITITNDGEDPAFGIVVSDELPASMTFEFCNTSCIRTGNILVFSTNRLAPGATFSASFFASLNCTAVDGSTITNTATVSSLTPDSNAANNNAAVSNLVSNPPFTISSPGSIFGMGGGSGAVNVFGSTNCSWTAVSNVSWLVITFSTGCCNGVVNYTVAPNPGAQRVGTLTIAGQPFTVLQLGIGGNDTIGLFRPSGNLFFLRNSNTPGFPDITTPFGAAGDLPIVGDWDGNGTVTLGLYRPSSSTFFLRNSNTTGFPDVTVSFGDGPGGDLPVAGDWNGDGVWTVGVYRPSTSTFYLRNSNTIGLPDLSIPFGAPGDLPIAGDWDGNGITTIGVYRPSGSIFYLRNINAVGLPDLSIPFGAAGDLPVVGDWNGNGNVTIGLYRPTGSIFYLRNSNTPGFPDLTIPFGATGDQPLVGDWDGN
jgi:uncharacterized repeat protein (TIGR01451 family)